MDDIILGKQKKNIFCMCCLKNIMTQSRAWGYKIIGKLTGENIFYFHRSCSKYHKKKIDNIIFMMGLLELSKDRLEIADDKYLNSPTIIWLSDLL